MNLKPFEFKDESKKRYKDETFMEKIVKKRKLVIGTGGELIWRK